MKHGFLYGRIRERRDNTLVLVDREELGSANSLTERQIYDWYKRAKPTKADIDDSRVIQSFVLDVVQYDGTEDAFTSLGEFPQKDYDFYLEFVCKEWPHD